MNVGKITVDEIEELCRKAQEYKVEISITAQPDGYELNIAPWIPNRTEYNSTIKPCADDMDIDTQMWLRENGAKGVSR